VDLDSYIGTHRPEWEWLDHACSDGSAGLARLSGEEIREVVRAYERASAQLAEVQTRFHDPATRAYLNGVVTKAHGAIYSSRPRTLAQGVSAFGSSYRAAARRTLPFILVAAAVVVAVTIASMLWVMLSHDARAGLLPAFAAERIRRATGRTTVTVPPPALSTFILLNNVQVAFLAFAFGITAGIGTVYMLIQNSLLLGVLAGAFTAFGRAGAFWALILPHGLLELTAICIAAGAGLRMGWSLIDPGDRPRSQALAEESRDAVLVVVGVVPAFAVAAFIEGFVTGRVPAGVSICLGLVVWAGYLLLLFGRPERRSLRPAAAAVRAGPAI
jgi:uncharacterized membrane protein SpoIIM required for sporulation